MLCLDNTDLVGRKRSRALVIRTADELVEMARRILLAAGADERNADIVADHLVSSNLHGVDTHGIWHLPLYVDWIKVGFLVPTAWPEIIHETPNSALVTGNWTFGQVAAKYAMEVALAKAEKQDIAVVGTVQAGSIGRLGYYAEMAAARQMISMICAGGYSEEQPASAPFGGRKPVLHTNPIALGFPAGEEPPMIADYATTGVSGGRVWMARERNQTLPPGWIIDKDGNPSTDPNDFFSGGAYLPFGGHKGYALMMAVEFLGRILTGSNAFSEPDRGGPILRHQGATMIVLRSDIFQPFADYARCADEMERRVRSVPPAPGFAEVLVPGDPEKRALVARERDGIPIDDVMWQQLTDVATALGVEI
jgi:LDH2 family malate/lactate/ureidoglycolate dehydrogenase